MADRLIQSDTSNVRHALNISILIGEREINASSQPMETAKLPWKNDGQIDNKMDKLSPIPTPVVEMDYPVKDPFMDPDAIVHPKPARMDLGSDQQMAMDLIYKTMRTGDECLIKGYAGTGKSTLLVNAYRQIRSTGRTVVVCAPTGKAALRARTIGAEGARTVHKLFYVPFEKEDGTVRFLRLSEAQKLVDPEMYLDGDKYHLPDDLVVLLDEASMVGPSMIEDIRFEMGIGKGKAKANKADRKLILFGDGFQLPPVLSKDEESKNGQFNLLDSRMWDPSKIVEMKEVFRQGEGSMLLHTLTALRKRSIPVWKDENLDDLKIIEGWIERFLPYSKAAFKKTDDGIAITWTNKDRQTANQWTRTAVGMDGESEIDIGEKLVVLQNSLSTDLFNGSILTVTDVDKSEAGLYESEHGFPGSNNVRKARFRWITYKSDSGQEGGAWANLGTLNGEKSRWDSADLKIVEKVMDNPAILVDYGYCLTAHKAQGSQWKKVAVYVPDYIWKMSGDMPRRWIYTALSRASDGAAIIGQSLTMGALGRR